MDYLKPLETRALLGLKEKYKEKADALREILCREITDIRDMDYAAELAAAVDVVHKARRSNQLAWLTGGWAAGSLTGYCLELTSVDPVPDIISSHSIKKYCKNHPNTRRTNDVLTVEVSYSFRKPLCRYLQEKWKAVPPLAMSFDKLSTIYGTKEVSHKFLNRAALVILKDNPGNVDMEESARTQFVRKDVSELRKMQENRIPVINILGHRGMDKMLTTLTLIKENGKTVPDIHNIPVTCARTAELLNRADTAGIDGLEGRIFLQTLRECKTRNFHDFCTCFQRVYPNKSSAESAEYAMIAYRAAFLKAHYPEEYAETRLRREKGKFFSRNIQKTTTTFRKEIQ